MPIGQGLSLCYGLPLLHEERLRRRNIVGGSGLHAIHFGGNEDLSLALHLPDLRNVPIPVGEECHLFGAPHLEELFNPGKTLGYVLPGDADAAGMEGPHGQLCPGLPDGLGRHYPDGLSHEHLFPRRKIHTIALPAYSVLEGASQGTPHPDLLQAGLFDLPGPFGVDQAPGGYDHLPRLGVHYIPEVGPADDPLAERDDHLVVLQEGSYADALVGATVIGGNDQVLGDIDEPPGQVA